MDRIKFTVIGAGSSYTPELMEELAQHQEALPLKEMVLYDIDDTRLDIMTGFSKRFAKRLGLDVSIRKTKNLEDALEGADFVDTQVRVGGNKARVFDEKIPMKYDLIGQETTGIGGMFKAFRTIPVMLEVAKTMERVSPDGWIVNYTNPTGLVTEAVTRTTKAKIAGFCSGGIFPKMWAKEALGVEHDRVQYDFAGLNHMNFITNVTIDAKPITDEQFMAMAMADKSVDPELVKMLGVMVSPYLQYYYQTRERLAKLQAAPQTRGEFVMEVEKEVFAAYADPENDEKPEALAKRGGGGYSEVAVGFCNAVYNNTDTQMVVNVPNNGAISFLPDSAVVEVGCLVNAHGVAPLHVADIPAFGWGLIAAVKNYEQLAVEAALEGDRRKAKLAMLAHPLMHEYALLDTVFEELLEAHKPYLPQFFKA